MARDTPGWSFGNASGGASQRSRRRCRSSPRAGPQRRGGVLQAAPPLAGDHQQWMACGRRAAPPPDALRRRHGAEPRGRHRDRGVPGPRLGDVLGQHLHHDGPRAPGHGQPDRPRRAPATSAPDSSAPAPPWRRARTCGWSRSPGNASRPFARVGTWPTKRRTGVESCVAVGSDRGVGRPRAAGDEGGRRAPRELPRRLRREGRTRLVARHDQAEAHPLAAKPFEDGQSSRPAPRNPASPRQCLHERLAAGHRGQTVTSRHLTLAPRAAEIAWRSKSTPPRRCEGEAGVGWGRSAMAPRPRRTGLGRAVGLALEEADHQLAGPGR